MCRYTTLGKLKVKFTSNYRGRCAVPLQKNRVLCHPVVDLGVAYTVHLWLIGKRLVDFLLVLIELYSPVLTVEAL